MPREPEGMMQRKAAFVLIAGIAVVGIVFARHYFSAEQVVKRRLLRARDAFEKEKLLGAISPFDKEYRDDYGGDWESVAGQVKTVMDSYDDLDLSIDIISITSLGEEIRMAIAFRLVATEGADRGYLLGGPDEPCRAILVWRKKSAGWMIVTTTDLDIPGHRMEVHRRRAASR
jgi:hypothetical protein